jgi:S1-C subfamily serine protease
VAIVDLIIIGLTLAVAVWGYRQGVMTGALVLVGFGGGALLGSRLAPLVLEGGLRDPYAPVLAVPAALLCGALLAAGLERVGFGLRRRLRGHGRTDAVGGALLAGLVGLVMVWIVAALVVRVDDLKDSVRDSAIVDALNAVLPPPGPLVNAEVSYSLPEIDGPKAYGRPAGVNVKRDPEVRAAKSSVVKIGVNACDSGRGGSGWIAGDGIVVTNAHVVEASDEISVQVEGKGARHDAEAIWYDDVNDLAILRSPGVSGERALPVHAKAKPGTRSAMLGFPGGGPYVVKPARLGVTSTIPGFRGESGQYVRQEVTRMIARPRPGNSGGPVVDLEGRVVAVVFAHDTAPGYTAYAVPALTVRRALRRAEGPVDTGSCDED